MRRSLKREQLLDIAIGLFNERGYHASGIDLILEEAGIAKTTLYRHFKTKEDLIVAVLKTIDERSRDGMRLFVDTRAKKPEDKLLATFDYLELWFKERTFYGCPFMSAAGEFGDKRSVIFQEAATHKRLVQAYFEELARAANLKNPKDLAEEINLLHEGATAVAHISGKHKAAQLAKQTARKLIDLSLDRRRH